MSLDSGPFKKQKEVGILSDGGILLELATFVEDNL